jgi:hypothetical protein
VKFPVRDSNPGHDTLIMSSTLCLLRHQCFVVKYTGHVCPWTSGSLYVSKLTTNLPGYGRFQILLFSSNQQNKRKKQLLPARSEGKAAKLFVHLYLATVCRLLIASNYFFKTLFSNLSATILPIYIFNMQIAILQQYNFTSLKK